VRKKEKERKERIDDAMLTKTMSKSNESNRTKPQLERKERDFERARIEGVKSFAATGASDESMERRVDKQEGRAKVGDNESHSGKQKKKRESRAEGEKAFSKRELNDKEKRDSTGPTVNSSTLFQALSRRTPLPPPRCAHRTPSAPSNCPQAPP
jgi:hypothetical protein